MMPRIRRVEIKNYKSISDVAVDLDRLTILVGANGSGKSNFMETLSFVQKSISQPIEYAFQSSGGVRAVRRISGGHPYNLRVRFVLDLDDYLAADYAFEISTKAGASDRVKINEERCRVYHYDGKVDGSIFTVHEFHVQQGKFTTEIPGIKPKLESDRFALYAASSIEEFRPVYDFLSSMRSYSINPAVLREPQESDPGDYLKRDGANAASILKSIKDSKDKRKYDRLCRLLEKIIPGIKKVEYKFIGNKETLIFRQEVGMKSTWAFEALNMSDGTLRALGLLLAVFQPGKAGLIMIEEPEATIHPGALEVIMEVLMNSSRDRQIMLTTHSPDILDMKNLGDEKIRVVSMRKNTTSISPVSLAGRAVIRDKLYTPGELLRVNELSPELGENIRRPRQQELFSEPPVNLMKKS